MRPIETDDLTGGLATSLQPTAINPSQSPDLRNVIIRDGHVQKRGGFQPIMRDRMLGDAIKNVPWRAVAQQDEQPGSINGEYISSPGMMVAGSRASITGENGLTIGLRFRPDNLVGEHSGNGVSILAGSSAAFQGAPYRILVYPIISKGPITKSGRVTGSTPADEWGPLANDSGLTYCIYLFNTGTGPVPIWSFRMSSHIFVGGIWTLQTVTSTLEVELGAKYHIIAQITDTQQVLHIAKSTGEITPLGDVYTNNTNTWGGTGNIGRNDGPIQVFDCPQQFIESTTIGTATQRPGLFIASIGSGGYWFGSVRPEATIDDISFWDPTTGPAFTDLESKEKVKFTGQDGILNLWDFSGSPTDYILETTGRGNHLFIAPRGPISVPDDGGKEYVEGEGGSWFFNGVTSYAQLDCDTAAWRYFDDPATPQPAAMWQIVRDNMTHGIAVEFWVDAIDPRYEQVVAEIHGVLKIVIARDGQIYGFCRDGGISALPATIVEAGGTYQGPVISTTKVIPGKRYAVTLMRHLTGTVMDLYVDGLRETQLVGLNPNNFQATSTSGNSYPPGGVTLGIGSIEPLMRAATADASPGPNVINTDQSSAFLGRIETFRIVCGADGPIRIKRHGPEDEDDWCYDDTRNWENPLGVLRDRIGPSSQQSYVRTGVRGAISRISSQVQGGVKIPFAVDTITSGYLGFYTLGGTTLVTSNFADGHEDLLGVGARTCYVLAYYRFNVDDIRANYPGAHVAKFELQYSGAAAFPDTGSINLVKHTHAQTSAITDQAGSLGVIRRSCLEPDIFDDLEDDAVMLDMLVKIRPYELRSPDETGIEWTTALAPSALGTVPVTLSKDYDVQSEGRRLAIAACAKTIYWQKPQWDQGELLFAGGLGSYALANTDPTSEPNMTGSTSKNLFEVAMWVKPIRLDGRRTLLAKRTINTIGNTARLVSWMIYTEDGALAIAGSAASQAWRFVEGTANSANDNFSGHNSLKVGVWNHVRIICDGTVILAYVNGDAVPLLDTNTLVGANQTSVFLGNASVEPIGVLYMGGFPEGWEEIDMGQPLIPGVLVFTTESWWGYMADVQWRLGNDATRWSSPPPMFTTDSASTYHWPMNEGRLWLLNNIVAATSAFDAESRISEFYPLKSGLRQEDGRHYESVSFRDSLIITNGAEKPQQVTFLGYTSKQLWRTERLGMAPPALWQPSLELTASTVGTAIAVGTYIFRITFVNDEGFESDATQFGTFELLAALGSMTIRLNNLPRSPDPQVVQRRIYASGTGGGAPLLNRVIDDNDGWDIDVSIGFTVGVAPPAGTNFPAPRARHVAVAGASLVLADLPDIPAGQNAFAFSEPQNASHFPITTTVVIDSEDGRPITGIGHNLENVYFSKRDSVYRLSVGAIVNALQVDAAVRLVQASDGFGGGVAPGSNMLFGAGDRGVFLFNGVDLRELSEAIERSWRKEVDRSNEALYGMHGAFWRAYSQYWISVRRDGQERNDRIFTYDVKSGSWTQHDVPEHAWMGKFEAGVDDPAIVIGNLDGQLLGYEDESIVEGARDNPNGAGTATLDGTSATGTSTQLIDGPNFDTGFLGLRGAKITVTYLDSGGATVIATRPIERNDATTIEWTEPLVDFVSYVSYVIGAFPAYWTSLWMRIGPLTRDQNIGNVGLEFVPRVGNVQVDIASVRLDEGPLREWPEAIQETFANIPMETGTTDRNLVTRVHKTGSYHRFRVGTYGIRDPFGLMSFKVDISPIKAGHRSGR